MSHNLFHFLILLSIFITKFTNLWIGKNRKYLIRPRLGDRTLFVQTFAQEKVRLLQNYLAGSAELSYLCSPNF